MKKQSKHFKETSSTKKSIPKIVLLFIFLIGTVVACQTTDTKTSGPPLVASVIIYGNVDSLNDNLYSKAMVFIMPHHNPCSDSTGKEDFFPNEAAFGSIKKSGTFKFHYSIVPGLIQPCFTIFVASYDIKDTSKYDWNKILAGPKKLGADFRSHFRTKKPWDSVRINFVVQNSMKGK